MYEDKDGNRYIPTVEKYEFEVGAKVDGEWQHIGVLRPKGDGAGKILKKFRKGKKYGKAFE